MTEYRFFLFFVTLILFLEFLMLIGAPMFAVPGIAEPPIPPEHWYEWPGYLMGVMGFMFKLMILPTVPTELKILSFVLFMPFLLMIFFIIIKFIAPVIADLVPF